MTETTIKFENEQTAEKTYRIGDKFVVADGPYEGDVHVLADIGGQVVLVSIIDGITGSEPFDVPDNAHTHLSDVENGYLKHLEHVEIVVK